MPCGSALRQFAFELTQPFQLGAKLLDHERDHPHRLTIRMADFLQYGTQRLFLAKQLLLDEFPAATKLLVEDSGTREPGKRDPSGKHWMVPLASPTFPFQGVRDRGAAS